MAARSTKNATKVINKSNRPQNIVEKERSLAEECELLQTELPEFLFDTGLYGYLRSGVAVRTRLAYLRDFHFFCRYLITRTKLTSAETVESITLEDIRKIKGSDVNEYLDFCRQYEVEENGRRVVYENHPRALLRKKSSISVVFKYLYRNGFLEKDITDVFFPIKVPKQREIVIKALYDDEVMRMLDVVRTGEGLTDREKRSWEKTKKRDFAIILLFITYGLRLYELQQLNLSSFQFSRGEFIIYRKRGKESIMPLNGAIEHAIKDYIENERPMADQILPQDRDALFISLKRNRFSERQIRDMIKKYTALVMDVGKNEGYSPHKLRATAATSLIGRGNSIYDVQELLDHDNVTTTQIYAAHKLDTKRTLIKNFDWLEDDN